MQFLIGQRVVKTKYRGPSTMSGIFAPINSCGRVLESRKSGEIPVYVEWDNSWLGKEWCFEDELTLESIIARANELATADIVGDGPRQWDTSFSLEGEQYGDGFDHPVLGPRHETLYPDSEPHLPPMEAFQGDALDAEIERLSVPVAIELSPSEYRKMLPLGTVAAEYFPLADQGRAAVSYVGNEKHNPGEHMHWSRGKSDDHVNCIHRHLQDMVQGDGWDTTVLPDGRVFQVRHAAAVAWRASAVAQLDAESVGGQVIRRLK